MKLILTFIYLLILLNSNCLGGQLSNEFVNLVVYNDETCSNSSAINYGIGYSISTDICVTADEYRNFVFTTTKNTISFRSYKHNGDETCGGSLVQSSTFPINTCVSSGVVPFDSTILADEKSYYFKLTTSSTPFFPTNAMIKTFMGNGVCSQDNILMVRYIVNGTQYITWNSGYFTYYCDSNKNSYYINCPTLDECRQPVKNNYNCAVMEQFYNASSDSSTSSNPTGSYSCESGSCNPTSSFSCESGTCSGTGYQSSGSSSTGGSSGNNFNFGINIENQQQSFNNGGRQDVSKNILLNLQKQPNLDESLSSTIQKSQFYVSNFCN